MKQHIVLTLTLLLITTRLTAVPSDWTVNTAQYEYSLTITAVVNLESGIEGTEGDAVAAFVNDECRGMTEAVYVDSTDTWYFFLTVFSNTYSGEIIQFKYYNKQENKIYQDFSTLGFSDGLNLGTASDAYTFGKKKITTGITINRRADFKMYPNPASDFCIIESKNVIKSVELYSMSGNLIQEAMVNDRKTSLFLEDIAENILIVKVFYRNGFETKRLIK